MKKESIIFIIIVAILLIALFVIATSSNIKEDLKGVDFTMNGNIGTLDKYTTENPVAALYIKNYGAVIVELYPSVAPNTVNNFISLIKSGFYDNNTFHRLMPGFVLQGGDPTGTGTGGPEYNIKGEFTANGFKNDLLHEEKVVSMARSTDYNSAGSQFFIMLGSAPSLDGSYAAFGKVVDGMEVEVMGDIQKKPADEWENIIPLDTLLDYVDWNGYQVPVLKLSYEAEAYRKLGRLEKAEQLERFARERQIPVCRRT